MAADSKNAVDDDVWRDSPTAPCGCAWDGYHCPHCGQVTTHSGDAWEPRHTIGCHRNADRSARRAEQPATATTLPVDDDF